MSLIPFNLDAMHIREFHPFFLTKKKKKSHHSLPLHFSQNHATDPDKLIYTYFQICYLWCATSMIIYTSKICHNFWQASLVKKGLTFTIVWLSLFFRLTGRKWIFGIFNLMDDMSGNLEASKNQESISKHCSIQKSTCGWVKVSW